MRVLVSAILSLALVACHKDPPPAPSIAVAPPPAPSPRDSGVFVIATVDAGPAVPPDAGPKTTATGSSSPAPSKESEAIAVFARDCHHIFTTTADQMGGEPLQKPECESRDFDQNCSPDQSGCWDGLQACKDGCSSPCSQCQSVCGDECDSCAKHCAGDEYCLTGCASDRQTCRLECLAGLTKCRDVTCETEASECNEKAAAVVAKACPDCNAISSCIEHARSHPNYDPSEEADCLKRYPKDEPECLSLCDPGS